MEEKKDKIVVDDIYEYDDFILRYETLNDEHKSVLKYLLDLFYQTEQEGKR